MRTQDEILQEAKNLDRRKKGNRDKYNSLMRKYYELVNAEKSPILTNKKLVI